jgi:hypothetical protein
MELRMPYRAFMPALLASMLACLAVPTARASLLLDASLSAESPFGPFLPTDTIIIGGTATNTSSNQSISICEGICIGDANTFSLGAAASIPNGYSFLFGNGGDQSVGFLDGQLNGVLAPLQSKQFIFAEFSPEGGVASPGNYSFFVQLQLFSATSERPFLGGSSYGGGWQVVAVPSTTPIPSALPFFAAGLVVIGFFRRKRQRIISRA